MQEAFNVLKGWYQDVTETSTKPCFLTLEQQTSDHKELYGKVEPPGESISINIDPFPVIGSRPSFGAVIYRGLRGAMIT